MKIRKLLGILIAVAMLAVIAIPFSASAAADTISINGMEGAVKNNSGEDDTYCSFEFDGTAMKLTVGESADGSASCYITGASLGDYQTIDLDATPYLYWDVSGDTTFDVYVRFANGDEGLAKLSTLSGNPDGVETGTSSINFKDAVANDSVLALEGSEITVSAIKWVVNGEAGKTVTFNKLYFGAEGQENADITSIETSSNDSSEESSTSPVSSTKVDSTSSQVETGEPVLPILGVTVLAVLSASAVIVSTKKSR